MKFFFFFNIFFGGWERCCFGVVLFCFHCVRYRRRWRDGKRDDDEGDRRERQRRERGSCGSRDFFFFFFYLSQRGFLFLASSFSPSKLIFSLLFALLKPHNAEKRKKTGVGGGRKRRRAGFVSNERSVIIDFAMLCFFRLFFFARKETERQPQMPLLAKVTQRAWIEPGIHPSSVSSRLTKKVAPIPATKKTARGGRRTDVTTSTRVARKPMTFAEAGGDDKGDEEKNPWGGGQEERRGEGRAESEKRSRSEFFFSFEKVKKKKKKTYFPSAEFKYRRFLFLTIVT